MAMRPTDNCYTDCKICGSEKLVVTDSLHQLLECTACGLVFAQNVYSTAELEALYKTLYNDGGRYASYYSSTLKLLSSGRTPWIGFERRAIVRYILEQRARVIGELGAGMGMTAQYLKPLNVEYHGIEFDRETAQMARRFGFDISCGDHSRLRDMRGELDAVVAFEVLEHVQDIKECLDDISACLRPFGLLGLTVPNYLRRLNHSKSELLGQDKPPMHVNFWTVQSLRRTLELCGFEPKILRARKRPNLNFKSPLAVLDAYFRLLRNRYYGPQIVCVAEKK